MFGDGPKPVDFKPDTPFVSGQKWKPEEEQVEHFPTVGLLYRLLILLMDKNPAPLEMVEFTVK